MSFAAGKVTASSQHFQRCPVKNKTKTKNKKQRRLSRLYEMTGQLALFETLSKLKNQNAKVTLQK